MPRMLPRYKPADRANHWFVALMFFLAGLSGLALFHPSLFFLSNLFGGGSWDRVLHPFMGVVMFLAFLGMLRRVWKDNHFTDTDRQWRQHMGDLLGGNKAAMPPIGKYNWGQKMVFWLMLWSLLVLLVTGVLFWRPWFDGYFSIEVQRAGLLLHAAAAVVLIVVTIVHIYAAIWVKGTMRAMTRGSVTEGWARLNHPLWHKEMTQGK